ncbi:MAG: LamG domain-containing protein, partial [Planctomycetota bacterium]
MRLTLASTLLPTTFLAGIASAQVPNDECTGAIPVTVGQTFYDSTGATDSLGSPAYACEPVNGKTDIWFEFTAPNTATYILELCGSTFDTVLEVLEGTCGSLTSVGCNDDTCGLQSIVQFPATAGTTYYVRPGGWGPSTGTGATGLGVLEINEFVPVTPPELVAHYPLNDTGMIAADASGNGQTGTYVNVTQGEAGIAGTSARFDGTTSYVEIAAANEIGNLRYDFTAMAWVNVDQAPTGGMRIFSNDGPSGSWSFSLSQFGISATTHAVLDYGANPGAVIPGTWHHVAIVMDESADVTFYFDGVQSGGVAMGDEYARNPNSSWFVGAWDPNFSIPQFFDGRIDDIQVYAGQLSAGDIATLFANPGTTLGGGNVGTPYCTVAPNSTGAGGALAGAGSPFAADNDLTLVASSLPNLAFGFFIVSPNQGFVVMPGGSAGNLCLSGQVGRYVGPGQIQQSNTMGTFSLALDLTQIPTPTGFISAAAGDTFNFQTWFRDSSPAGPTSNFTNGLE